MYHDREADSLLTITHGRLAVFERWADLVRGHHAERRGERGRRRARPSGGGEVGDSGVVPRAPSPLAGLGAAMAAVPIDVLDRQGNDLFGELFAVLRLAVEECEDSRGPLVGDEELRVLERPAGEPAVVSLQTFAVIANRLASTVLGGETEHRLRELEQRFTALVRAEPPEGMATVRAAHATLVRRAPILDGGGAAGRLDRSARKAQPHHG